MTSFSAQVDKWTRKTADRMERVFKESAQRTFEIAQVPTGKGGRMRIDTGFLRATGQASLSGAPIGPSDKSEGIPQNNTALVIASARIGDTITYGWTANYAEFRNFKDGFMTDAIQKWQQTVDEVVRDAKARIR